MKEERDINVLMILRCDFPSAGKSAFSDFRRAGREPDLVGGGLVI